MRLPDDDGHVCKLPAQDGDSRRLGEELPVEDWMEGRVRSSASTGRSDIVQMWPARECTHKLYMTRSCERERALTSALRRQAIFAATEPEPQPACSA